MGHTFIVTHTDLDGVASAAVYLRVAGVKPDEATVLYAEPYNLDEALEGIAGEAARGDILAIMDLGLNQAVLEDVIRITGEIASRGAVVEWYDHHVWGAEAERLRAVGVRLYLDRSTCATGVVARYASEARGVKLDAYTAELVSAVCAADLWRWTHPMAPKLFRTVGRGDEDEWRARLLVKLYSGVMWDSELEERLGEYVDGELRGFTEVLKSVYVKDVGGCRVAAVYKREGPPSNSMIGSALLYRLQADIAVIARENGALSLRSRRVDVQRVASALGGGGHRRAAGARVDVPAHVRILRPVLPSIYTRYVASLVASAARAAGVCRG